MTQCFSEGLQTRRSKSSMRLEKVTEEGLEAYKKYISTKEYETKIFFILLLRFEVLK